MRFRLVPVGVAGLVVVSALAAQVEANSVVFNAVRTGALSSAEGWSSPAYETGITSAFGSETRGLIAFDVSALPAVQVQSAVLSVQNPYSVNEVGGPLELRLYGLPYTTWSNHTMATNFHFIGSTGSPLWGTQFVNPVSWPGSTVQFTLPPDALAALQDTSQGIGPYTRDFFAFGFKVIKADVQEPKPRQYVFGGTSAGGMSVQLQVQYTPLPEPSTLCLAGLMFGLASGRRSGRAGRRAPRVA